MTTINLEKGGKADLTKNNPGLTKIAIGLGWKPNAGNGDDFDLDAFAIVKAGNTVKEIVYFNNLKSKDGSVAHSGDNLTGEGDGDDETIFIELPNVDPASDKIYVGANIYKASERKQNFGMVKDAYCRIYNADTNEELVRHDLSEDFTSATGVVFGDIYRHNGEFKVEILDEPKNGDLNQIVASLN